jgi:hypothetical protein
MPAPACTPVLVSGAASAAAPDSSATVVSSPGASSVNVPAAHPAMVHAAQKQHTAMQ